MLSKLYSSPVSESSECVSAFVFDSWWRGNVLVIFWFFLFCRRTLFIKSSGVNVSGRVNCLITRLISIWPSLIWALMGLCCLVLYLCECVCGPVFMVHSEGIFLLFNCGWQKKTCITRVSVPNWLSDNISLSVYIGYWIMFVHFPYFLHLTFAVIKHSVNF